jgi:xanthine dehydrogenase YagR molybdenum-binding subunit
MGRIVNNNLAEYHVPVHLDIPRIEALWVDEEDHRVNPIGLRGIAEIGITGAAAACRERRFPCYGKAHGRSAHRSRQTAGLNACSRTPPGLGS